MLVRIGYISADGYYKGDKVTPTLIVMKNGEVAASAVGVQSKQALLAMIQ